MVTYTVHSVYGFIVFLLSCFLHHLGFEFVLGGDHIKLQSGRRDPFDLPQDDEGGDRVHAYGSESINAKMTAHIRFCECQREGNS